MNARLRIVPALLGCMLAAAPAIAQGGAKLAVGPAAGGYLCPDGRQLYVKDCFNNSPDANCGVVLMHLPPQNGFQRETTETRSKLLPSVAACKVYPLEFRKDGTVGLVLPKSAPQQAGNPPAASPAPKAAATPKPKAPGANITIVDGMAIGRDGVRSSLVRVTAPERDPPVVYVDEASRRETGQKDVVAIWSLQVWPKGTPSDAGVGAIWIEVDTNCKLFTYELIVGISMDLQGKVLRADAMGARGNATKDPKTETPASIACKTTAPSKGPRLANAKAAIADALATPKPVAKSTARKVIPKPEKAPIRLPATESEKAYYQAVKQNLLQLAMDTIVKVPDRKTFPLTELTDEQGMTPLHWAAENTNAAATRWLLDKDSELDLADNQGRTPLRIALGHKAKNVMLLLLDRGASPWIAWPGFDREWADFKKTSDLVDYMIANAAPAQN